MNCERTMCIPMCVIMLMALIGGVTVSGQNDGGDVIPVKVKWGISEGMAHVGRLYRMHIPSDAFQGKLLSYVVTTAEDGPLPKWLDFDATDNVLVGVPTRRDIGETTVKVVAKGKNSEDYVLFTITVKDLPSLTSGSPLKFRKSSGPEVIRCKRDEAETVATIVIDYDLEASPVFSTVNLLSKFLHHMDLQAEMVKMVPVGSSSLQDSSALVSGPGDCTEQKTAGTFLSWPVGCGQVKEGHFKVLQRLDDDSRSGQMAKVIGHSIIGWHVSNSHLQPLKRKRRQAMATATMSITPTMATRTEEKTDDAGEKMTRDVPIHSSPAVIQPTATQPMMSKTAAPEVMPTYKVEDSTMVKASEQTPVVTTPSKTKELPPIQPTATIVEPEKSMTPKPTPPAGCVRGERPIALKPFKRLDFNVGDVINHAIPADAFEDCEVGGTRGLNLILFKGKTEKIKPDFFVQFDEKKQSIVGLPMEVDGGRYKMTLVGRKDSSGILASIPFTLVIKGTKNKKKINHELSVSIDYDYDKFIKSVDDKTMLAKKVASLYGDSDTSNLVITKMERGSVVYGWANKSMSSGDCPVGDIKDMVGKLVNEDGTLSDEAIEKMKPYYLQGAASVPAGPCDGNPDFPTVTSLPRVKPTTSTGEETTGGESAKTDAPVVKPSSKTPDKTTEKVGKSADDSGDDDMLITTIVPAIVIVVILIIALLIACILYRKKRKGKMNVEEQNTFVNKGAPVIFPDELEDKPSDVNKPLLVEGSPAPPEYHRGTSESPDPEMNNHRNGPTHDDMITEMPERPYDPPPPFAVSSNNKQPRPTQQPMSQHPQILP